VKVKIVKYTKSSYKPSIPLAKLGRRR